MSPKTRIRVSDIASSIERLAPLALAESFDRVGLAVGSRSAVISRVMVSLESDCSAVAEAVRRRAQMLITHHPPTLDDCARIDLDTPFGRMVAAALVGRVNVYCAHTNLDNAAHGTNDLLCTLIGVRDPRPLLPLSPGDLVRLVVFVPENDLDKVRSAVCSAGAGRIGNYDNCSWATFGTGSFRPGPRANPTIGRVGRLESVGEVRLEVVLPRNRIADVVAALKAAHSYEEPAYDVYSLLDTASGAGAGRVGRLDRPMTLVGLVRRLKRVLKTRHVSVIRGGRTPIRRVAVCGGSGASLLEPAASAGAHAFITGELKYHDALAARALRLTVIQCGHYTTEIPLLSLLKDHLSADFPDLQITTCAGQGEPATIL